MLRVQGICGLLGIAIPKKPLCHFSGGHVPPRYYSTTAQRLGRDLYVTDPCYATSKDTFHEMLLRRHLPLSVKVHVSDALYESIEEGIHMEEIHGLEYYFSTKDKHLKDDFLPVGGHMTDSGMVSIVDAKKLEGPDAKANRVSWRRFVDVTLNDEELRQHEDYHYMFFAKVPSGDVGVTVYAKYNDDHEAVALMIKAGMDETEDPVMGKTASAQ